MLALRSTQTSDFEIADDASVRNSHLCFFPHVILDVRR